jgi:hypothetical protein
MAMKINYLHVTEGGSMITNFISANYPKILTAIKRFHKQKEDKILFVKKKAYVRGDVELVGHYSLHFKHGKNQELSAFWDIYFNL